MEENKVMAHSVDAEFEEVQEQNEQEAPQVKAQLIIALMDNGQLDLSIPEGMPELQAVDMEAMTRQVFEQLRDMRIANTAIEIFKKRLG